MLADDPLVGTFAGRYRIERLLARGGMGHVYAALQPEIGSRVAIKILDEKSTEEPELVERFFAEARAVNLIAHENIVKVLDLAWLDDGRPYIVMEYVDGVTLTQLARGGRAPLGGVMRVMTDILSALAATHERGIVHRDLKPDNIIVTAKGHAKVLDFGIAKLAPHHLHTAAARTATGALLGTPAYMAPEQVSGARDVDARTDIYAAGAVLFHAVTGRAPFAGATMFDIMRAHVEEPPPSPRALRPGLPPSLERVILTALAKDPAQRYQRAAEMSAALEAAADDIPDGEWGAIGSGARTSQREMSRAPREMPPARRDTPPAMSAVAIPASKSRRWLFGAAAAAVLAAIGVAVLWPSRARLDPPIEHRAMPVAIVTPDVAVATPDAAVAMVIDAATIVVDARVHAKRAQAVDAAAPDAAPPDASSYIVKKRIEIPRGPDDELTIEQLQAKYQTAHLSRPKHDVPTRALPYVKYILGDIHDFSVRDYVGHAAAIVAAIPVPKPGAPGLLIIHVDYTQRDGVIDFTEMATVEYVFRLASATPQGCIARVEIRDRLVRAWVMADTVCAGTPIRTPVCNPSQLFATSLKLRDAADPPRSYEFTGMLWRVIGSGTVVDQCP
jgi:tRNA A-37 threonylcarbamoyl transferase component Bud32